LEKAGAGATRLWLDALALQRAPRNAPLKQGISYLCSVFLERVATSSQPWLNSDSSQSSCLKFQLDCFAGRIGDHRANSIFISG
jgi:hypothetical protein